MRRDIAAVTMKERSTPMPAMPASLGTAAGALVQFIVSSGRLRDALRIPIESSKQVGIKKKKERKSNFKNRSNTPSQRSDFRGRW